jgi:hypothetical protein
MPVNFPPALAAGLREIAGLPDAIFDSLVAGLRALPAEIKQYRIFSETGFELHDLPDHGRSVKGAALFGRAPPISASRRAES